ncbi:sigma-70 family RNA polymerase sigma factor [Saccharibacillus sacchari]|uniref:Sigma-70 family RNA polymerase sigma factor n=1 Tax=Saccharibacillus sacchari TaxID=456493 RepID=A0ACC6PGB4_9BACL
MEQEQEHRRDEWEQKIVQRIRNRDEQALREMIDHYGGLLKAIVYRHLPGSLQDREECLDDVLIAVWNHIASFDQERNSFKQWIAAVAKYRAIDYRRRWVKENERRAAGEPDTHRLHDTRHDEASLRSETDEVLAHLPEQERRLFEQYYLDGVPVREIAQEHQVKESWIHNKLSRGRKKLKKIGISRNGVEHE